ncbi:hypothetical protein PG993_004183 [Apiospora rasikravindrae]|uniref:Uncharacterized protein n=1 Tax=Apiospora rasikravindrae TaxID=990691 RepID=A0ABR1TC26_9PEZI
MPSTSKKSTSAQEKRSGHEKKQSSKRSASTSMVVNASPTASTMSFSDAQGSTADQGPNGGGDGSSHDTQYYLQCIGSQFDNQNGGGQ